MKETHKIVWDNEPYFVILCRHALLVLLFNITPNILLYRLDEIVNEHLGITQ